MIHSMTGFGKSEGQVAGQKISVQLKSLNSKQTDINIKVPNSFKEKELIFRQIISEKLGRGKVEMYLSYENSNESGQSKIDEKTFLKYYRQLKSVHTEMGEKMENISATICQLPNVLITEEEENFNETEWKQVDTIVRQAVDSLIDFRLSEGQHLFADLSSHIQNIESLLQEALSFEKERIDIVKERLQKNLEDISQKEKMDQNRFEQEMIYYLEKYDISEEKVRLSTHCNYFVETMKESAGQGKKLGFIGQEIGREINTLGSKANHAGMQKVVVQMKDELEKIKEQVLNVW